MDLIQFFSSTLQTNKLETQTYLSLSVSNSLSLSIKPQCVIKKKTEIVCKTTRWRQGLVLPQSVLRAHIEGDKEDDDG